jgi:hypothetical protein
MENGKMKELLTRYNAGVATQEDVRMLESLIERGLLDLSQLDDVSAFEQKIENLQMPFPSMNLDDRFHHMMHAEKQHLQQRFSWKKFFSWPDLLPKLAFASITLLLGLAGGYYLRSPQTSSSPEMAVLSKEVRDLREMMALSLLEKASATERLKAVSLTQEMDKASKKITSALLETLNNDSNVNVRLAALDALKPYAKDSNIREALIRSIGTQESPLVQVALAELMAALQEKSSVNALEKILQDERTPNDVKKRIKQSIEVLI